jgi:hypothetical protein
MALYSPGFVISGGIVIGMPFIESIDLHVEEDEEIIDRLKGDVRFNISTVSGKEYTLSMLQHQTTLTDYSLPTDTRILGQAILEKWCYIMENKCGNATK